MRVGIIGCGTIAQIMHIPYVVELPGVELYALSDPATDRVQALAEQYNVPHHFEHTEDLLADVGNKLDAVIILTPPHTHAENVVQTLDAGVHTLVEKPLSIHPADADRMVKAAEESDVTAMVAYMKRYDSSYERALEVLPDADEIDLVSAYDVDPDHGRIIDEVYDIVRGEVSEEFIEETSPKRMRMRLPQSTSTTRSWPTTTTGTLNTSATTSTSSGASLGTSSRLTTLTCSLTAATRRPTSFTRTMFGVRSTPGSPSASGSNSSSASTTSRECSASTSPIPFIKNTPTKLRVKEGIDELTDTTHVPSYDESFKREVQHFLAAASGDEDATIRTPF